MPAGSGGQIAITKTDSLYVSINSIDQTQFEWTNFVSETVEHNLNELQEGAITGYKDAPPSYKGADFGTGDIQLEPNPNALGRFLAATFGQSSGTLLTHAGSWGANSGNALNLPAGYAGARPVVQHRFNPIQTATDAFTFLPPHEVMIYKDVGSAFFFEGSVFHTLALDLQAGQLTKATATLMSRKVTRFARTSSLQALRNPGGKPWVWDMASIQTGPGVNSLTAQTNFESLSIKLDTPIEGVLLLDGTKNYAEFQVNGFRTVELNGTISFRDQTAYDDFIAYNTKFLRLSLYNVNSAGIIGNPSSAYYYGLEIDIPQMLYLSWSTPIRGPNRLQTQFRAKAQFDPTSLYMIEARLTNTTSAYLV